MGTATLDNADARAGADAAPRTGADARTGAAAARRPGSAECCADPRCADVPASERVSAAAVGLVARANPTPRAKANAPTRPIGAAGRERVVWITYRL